MIGVYRIRCKKTGHAYVGASVNVSKRWGWHRSMLDAGKHSCKELQRLWDRHGSRAFVFELLQRTTKARLRKIEDEYSSDEKKLVGRTNSGFRHSTSTRDKMSSAAIQFGSLRIERERRSQRARQQHESGNFGSKTWVKGPSYNQRSAIAGTKALRAHIAEQSSEEMSRRAKLRKRMYNRWTGEYIEL